MSVKPFHYTNLKKISSQEIHLVDSLFELMPATSARDFLSVEIRKMLMRHLGERSFYYLDAVAHEPFAQFLSALPEFPILAVISVESLQGKMILQLDAGLVQMLIDKLLGGGGNEMSAQTRPLSETEQGILQYLIMQVLAQVWKSFGESTRFHFRFERFFFSTHDIEKIGLKNDSAVSLVYKVGIGELSGFAKVVVLESFINKVGSLNVGVDSKEELDYFINCLRRYDYLHTTLWAEAGKVNVSSSDLTALESGDVVLFDETGIVLKNNAPEGEVYLRIGKGEGGGIRAQMDVQGGVVKCRI